MQMLGPWKENIELEIDLMPLARVFRAEKRNEHAGTFWPDPLAGFEKMAGFQIFFCLKLNVSTHNLESTSNLYSKVANCGYNLLITYFLEEFLTVKRTLTTLISLRCTGNVHA